MSRTPHIAPLVITIAVEVAGNLAALLGERLGWPQAEGEQAW